MADTIGQRLEDFNSKHRKMVEFDTLEGIFYEISGNARRIVRFPDIPIGGSALCSSTNAYLEDHLDSAHKELRSIIMETVDEQICERLIGIGVFTRLEGRYFPKVMGATFQYWNLKRNTLKQVYNIGWADPRQDIQILVPVRYSLCS